MDRSRIAVIGGGLGGILTAYFIEARTKVACDITVFEATHRLGGKIVTRQFDFAPVSYEAGVAELYDYSQLGPDPLRQLIADLGLSTLPIEGQTVVQDGRILRSPADLGREFGDLAEGALARFDARAKAAISPSVYYESDWTSGTHSSLAYRTFRDLLESIDNQAARRYLDIMIHSDLATEPHLTSAIYGLQNYLMNDPNYMRLYTIEGGIEQLPLELARRIRAQVRLEHCVTRIEKTSEGNYRTLARNNGRLIQDEFDYIVVALPNNWLTSISWGDDKLSSAIHEHHVYYDYPAHYLRVSILFSEPFWREQLAGSYFMLDAFGGCCVYDESYRNHASKYGALGWLLAGDAAMSMGNLDDQALIKAVLDSLPASLAHGRARYLEGRVHRWVGAVNGMPGGRPPRDPDSRHQPEPEEHQDVLLVGDYLFDSTINGVLDSADLVSDWIVECVQEDAEQLTLSDQSQLTVNGRANGLAYEANGNGANRNSGCTSENGFDRHDERDPAAFSEARDLSKRLPSG